MNDLAALLEIVAKWRSDGHIVGFVNGCFDVLHPGHLHLLDQARSHASRLIVAVNTDEYCREHKGPNRPIQPADVRARVARSVADADVGIVFEGHSPVPLLYRLRPDVYVVGEEYRPAPGAAFCGRVHYVERLPGYSTTAATARFDRE